jgi:hypothetical protein
MENVQVYRFKKEPDFVPNGKKKQCSLNSEKQDPKNHKLRTLERYTKSVGGRNQWLEMGWCEGSA